MRLSTTALFVALAFAPCLMAADWLGFRGTQSSGSASTRLPETWGDSGDETENIAWRQELPGRGISGPIVVEDRVLVTACSGYRQDRLHVLCFSDTSGAKLWERQLWATGRTMTHPKTCTAAPTPVSDGQRVYAYYSTNDVACFDLDGNLQWVRGLSLQYPNASNSLGLASSPVVVDGVLVIKIETDSQSLAVGLDAQTGQTKWEIDRPKRASWASPLVLRRPEGGSLVTLQSGEHLTAYDPQTGEPVWQLQEGCDSKASSITNGETVYVPTSGLLALRPRTDGEPEVLWENFQLRSSTSTPLIHNGRVITFDGKVLGCGDAQTGDVLWKTRVSGRFSSSPVAADGHVVIFNEDGKGYVVRIGEKEGEIVGGGDLNEEIIASPAVANGAIYIRSDQHLWKIGSPN